jgi:DNA-binding response OmpR family regulator
MNITPPTPPRILLAEEDTRLLNEQKQYLASLGYEVVAANSEKKARELFGETSFDLAIINLMMTNKDAGIVLAHHLKQIQPATPIIMLSNLTAETGMVFDLAGPGERRWIKVDRILTKPVRLEQLAFEAEALLGPKSLGAAIPNAYDDNDPHRLEI